MCRVRFVKTFAKSAALESESIVKRRVSLSCIAPDSLSCSAICAALPRGESPLAGAMVGVAEQRGKVSFHCLAARRSELSIFWHFLSFHNSFPGPAVNAKCSAWFRISRLRALKVVTALEGGKIGQRHRFCGSSARSELGAVRNIQIKRV